MTDTPSEHETALRKRAEAIARGVWEARASTGTDTLSTLIAIVFKELAADEVRRVPRAGGGPVISPPRYEPVTLTKAAERTWQVVTPSLEEIAADLGVTVGEPVEISGRAIIARMNHEDEMRRAAAVYGEKAAQLTITGYDVGPAPDCMYIFGGDGDVWKVES